uniref:Speriolin n=2 Tax=Mus musculus TaxID=10090 RepID=SPERI_MOUSE|nr:RecName: Full=Speriolin; AltName: Full=Spermatogenesis and centriole-associated protein 1; AltName: Full=Spermatogenic cell-specific Cdc20-binding protein [Mus musculus]AAI18510.1 Spermatogenesis and centriole associated 1 [Mus musculus]
MSLLTSYEGLRHQIERLVRENEELKKLVRLIRENQELKSAIKTQAGGLCISGFTGGLGEAAAGPPQHQGVFLPPASAAAKEPCSEDLGMVALAPLADMLNTPQLSPAAGSLVNPLAATLNPLLSGQIPLLQNNQFANLVPCSMSNQLTNPTTVSPGVTLASSLGLPSTGPLNSQMTSPMTVPPGTTLASSLGLTSTGSLTTSSRLVGPLAVSQSSPIMAPLAGTVAVSLSSPLLSSTATPLGVAQNVVPNPINNIGQPETPRVRRAEPTRGNFSGTSAYAGPAPTSKVNDTRGSRVMEQSRKNVVEMERKTPHRKSNKLPDNPRDTKQLVCERLVGEIAFQLDRRILSSIFPERVRLYGFTVSNIPEKIIQASLNPSNHKLDEDLCQTLTQRYVSIMNKLQSLGYNGRVHPALTEQLVNEYGILRERPELAASEGGCYTVDFLQRVLLETVHPSKLTDALLLLSCLHQLSHDDGKPMFIW